MFLAGVITGPPTHSVGASIVLLAAVCRCRLSSSVVCFL